MIEIKNIHKTFSKNKVLKGINLSFTHPGVYAVLGPNGSGKTTLIKCILGMVIPDKGEIKIQGDPIQKEWLYRKQIDYLPQIANFPGNLRVSELIRMIKDLRSANNRCEQQLIEQLGLTPYLDKKLSNLSGGTRQKVNLVLTFLFDSPFLILDEPTTGLDPVALLILKTLIDQERKKGKIVVLTSHIMSFVEEVSDEIVFLLEGKVYFKGSSSQLKEKTKQPSFEHAIANLLTQTDYA